MNKDLLQEIGTELKNNTKTTLLEVLINCFVQDSVDFGKNIIETLFNSIKSLMKSMKWTAEQAMTAMNVSENDEMLLKTRF